MEWGWRQLRKEGPKLAPHPPRKHPHRKLSSPNAGSGAPSAPSPPDLARRREGLDNRASRLLANGLLPPLPPLSLNSPPPPSPSGGLLLCGRPPINVA